MNIFFYIEFKIIKNNKIKFFNDLKFISKFNIVIDN